MNTELVRKSLADARKPLAACLSADASAPRSGRVSMVVSGAGEIEGVFVTPTSLQACVEPVLRGKTLPATRSGRQRVTYEIQGANAASTPDEKPEKKAEQKANKKPAAKR